MKLAAKIILLLAVALLLYGYWGIFTSEGNRIYDEMDGYIPFFGLLGGGVLLIVFVVLQVLIRRKKR